jgi:hypothetical protein
MPKDDIIANGNAANHKTHDLQHLSFLKCCSHYTTLAETNDPRELQRLMDAGCRTTVLILL